jgi:hypothetical protein
VTHQDSSLQQRAESGDPDAQMNLAVMLDNSGLHEQALDWLRKAADAGHAPAQFVLGARLLVGRAAPFEPTEGTRRVDAAARQGMPQALSLMGVLATLSGEWSAAVNLTKDAASRGDPRAREQIALIGDPLRFDAQQWDTPMTPQWKFQSPRILVLENFIPRAFCEWIIQRARPKLEAARVKDPLRGGSREVEYRSNSGAGFSLIDSDLVLQMVNSPIPGPDRRALPPAGRRRARADAEPCRGAQPRGVAGPAACLGRGPSGCRLDHRPRLAGNALRPPVFPTRKDLDAVVADRPVFLTRADGHGGVANSRALALAGIDRDTEAPFGGEILKDAEGEPTGMLIDRARRWSANTSRPGRPTGRRRCASAERSRRGRAGPPCTPSSIRLGRRRGAARTVCREGPHAGAQLCRRALAGPGRRVTCWSTARSSASSTAA